jgi:microcystin-dependent protein
MPDPFLGEIRCFGFNFAPQGWLTCSGQLLSISSYSALFSLLGTMYGGDGRTTFGLPDLQGRMSVSFGQGNGLESYAQGQVGGSETVTLAADEIPPHLHPVAPRRPPRARWVPSRPSPRPDRPTAPPRTGR